MCKKPKPPDNNKAIVLIIIVILLCHALKGVAACFGPVEKVRLFNDRGAKGTGYVEVRDRQVFARKDTDVFLYKISTELKDHKVSFFLYDPAARKFICWNRKLERVVGMNYTKITHSNYWSHCKFIDNPSERPPYQELLWASNSTVKLKFNQKGRHFTPKMLKNCKKRAKLHIKQRHLNHQCKEYSDFMVLPSTSGSEHQCRHEAYDTFCISDLRHMTELKGICRVMKKRLKNKNNANLTKFSRNFV